jgi:hypothetical protein
LVEKTEGNRPFVRTKYSLESNVKLDFKETGGRVWTGFILLRIGAFKFH